MPSKPEKKTDVGEVIDNATKVLTALIAAGGFVWGIYVFRVQQRTNETLEFKRKLWEKRLDTYNKLSNVVGEIIIYRDKPETFDSLKTRFDFYYYSAMVMVEDTIVERSMVRFAQSIRDFRDHKKTEVDLKRKAVDLMKETSNSLRRKQELLYDE